jgi:hypothetical protein
MDGEIEKLSEWDSTGRNEGRERLTLDQLHREEADAIGVLDGVEGDDVRMVEARNGARFPLEPGEAVRRGRNVRRSTLTATSRPNRRSLAR